ncbi:uncharacterized protein LOC108732284 isoform X2 [Agrilus planipennis]|uniref:Sterile alpha motif domain-containing protein 5 n=1 Tax=Agrilus planipennis TaxID=224129 RepID=A0A1W4WDF3_AGRPL|nr:uncharacterized protein LOC108732284 isoform X2 [Agrilus planipennis]
MCSTTLTSNIVREWLKSLCLGQYADSFIDNGYDDLEICKQIGDPDLDAIGVFNPVHRTRLLESVRTLREEGAASVYFTLEETVAAVQDECYCDSVSAHSQTSSSEKETTVTVTSAAAAAVIANVGPASDNSGRNVVVMTTSPGSEGSSGIRQMDEYEEGKAELVRIPRIKLQALLRDKLSQDGIRLSCQPYSTTDGERGYLEGLASRYADLFCTHYGDVLNHLEELRKKELTEISSQDKSLSTTPNRKYANVTAISNAGITSSQSQPIYVPGKYSPSSCLSDKEEDEIYGFGYGVFGVQIARQQQQRIMAAAEQGNNSQQLSQHFYQTCLSPRSAFFYEFPPNENANYANTGKKRTTFSRFLRGLKTAHRKEKHGGSSPRHGRATSGGAVPQRVDTPDSVLQSGLGLPADLAQSNVLRSMIDPRDYDRLRYLQMNGGGPSTFEETIYRLKVQEAQKKREKITKEHEEILRNIREGLMHLGKGTFRGHLTADDTYMYDEDVRMLAPATYDRGHWYDEPPYESDPEDFLMRGSPGPTATIENGRVCFTLNQRQEQCAEGIISLRSAGDISLPKEGNGRAITGHSKCRKLLISRRDDESPSLTRMRESGDYAGSDIQSVSSRISTLSMDTSRSDQLELMHFDDNLRKYHKKCGFTDRLQSPNHSSDYEDQEDYDSCNPQIATVHVSDEGRMGVSNLVGRVRGLREDVQKKISKLRNESSTDQEKRFEHSFPCSASSVESIPSGSGSSTQALVRAGSNHSSISVEDIDSSPADPQIIGRARALVDYTPTPYDKEALKFKIYYR